jgi:arylsulfatase A-like enzyme
MDLYTTLSLLAGVPVPDDRVIDGMDLGPVLFEGKESPRKEMFFYRGDRLFAVRVGDYKAHFITQGGYSPGVTEHDPPLLYNLNQDPSEKYDVAADHPEVIEAIKEVVRTHNENMVKGPDMLKDRGAP